MLYCSSVLNHLAAPDQSQDPLVVFLRQIEQVATQVSKTGSSHKTAGPGWGTAQDINYRPAWEGSEERSSKPEEDEGAAASEIPSEADEEAEQGEWGLDFDFNSKFPNINEKLHTQWEEAGGAGPDIQFATTDVDYAKLVRATASTVLRGAGLAGPDLETGTTSVLGTMAQRSDAWWADQVDPTKFKNGDTAAASLKGWVSRIAHNLAADFVKKLRGSRGGTQTTEQFSTGGDSAFGDAGNIASDELDPSQTLENTESNEEVPDLIKRIADYVGLYYRGQERKRTALQYVLLNIPKVIKDQDDPDNPTAFLNRIGYFTPDPNDSSKKPLGSWTTGMTLIKDLMLVIGKMVKDPSVDQFYKIRLTTLLHDGRVAYNKFRISTLKKQISITTDPKEINRLNEELNLCSGILSSYKPHPKGSPETYNKKIKNQKLMNELSKTIHNLQQNMAQAKAHGDVDKMEEIQKQLDVAREQHEKAVENLLGGVNRKLESDKREAQDIIRIENLKSNPNPSVIQNAKDRLVEIENKLSGNKNKVDTMKMSMDE